MHATALRRLIPLLFWIERVLADAAAAVAAGAQLTGRSENPMSLFFDALFHPGADGPRDGESCLEMRYFERAKV